jgi:hypothetical protein
MMNNGNALSKPQASKVVADALCEVRVRQPKTCPRCVALEKELASLKASVRV